MTTTKHSFQYRVDPNDPVTKLEIGSVIRQARKAKGFRQKALAVQLGLKGHSHLTNIEKGNAMLSLELAERLEKALDLQPKSLVVMVLKGQMHELTQRLIQEAKEYGVKLEVRPVFK